MQFVGLIAAHKTLRNRVQTPPELDLTHAFVTGMALSFYRTRFSPAGNSPDIESSFWRIALQNLVPAEPVRKMTEGLCIEDSFSQLWMETREARNEEY